MKDVLEKLTDLQQIDLQLDDVVSLRGDLPEKVNELESQLAEVKDKCDKFNAKYTEVKSEIAKLEASLEHEKEELAKDEAHIYDVKNNKEYDAITAQIKVRKQKIEDNTTAIKELHEKEALIKEHVDKYNTEFDEETSELTQMKKELQNTIAETEEKESQLEKDKDALRTDINDRYLRIYDRIRTSKKDAIADMKKHSCTGCRSVLPRQQQAEILKQESLVFCESCGRIVVLVPEEEETKTA